MNFPQNLFSQAFLVASTIIIQFFLPKHNAQLRFMKAQIRFLKSRLGDKRILTTAEERAELVKLGEECNHQVSGLIQIVKYATYCRWIRDLQTGKETKQLGRPKIEESI